MILTSFIFLYIVAFICVCLLSRHFIEYIYQDNCQVAVIRIKLICESRIASQCDYCIWIGYIGWFYLLAS